MTSDLIIKGRLIDRRIRIDCRGEGEAPGFADTTSISSVQEEYAGSKLVTVWVYFPPIRFRGFVIDRVGYDVNERVFVIENQSTSLFGEAGQTRMIQAWFADE